MTESHVASKEQDVLGYLVLEGTVCSIGVVARKIKLSVLLVFGFGGFTGSR